uniref:Uncharacterized protein n=1 Tax=Anopheles albimanus TaxID=7167 RepID=A0A182F7I6_ANOAL
MVLRLANLSGVDETPEHRYRFVIMFIFFVIVILVPKVVFGFPDVESSIIGLAELVFEVNNFVGMLIMFGQSQRFSVLKERLQQFADDIYSDGSGPLIEALRTTQRKWERANKLFCQILFCSSNVYCCTPMMFSLWSYCDTLRNENSTMQYAQHMEENFYGLETRTSFVNSTILALVMIPMTCMCALNGGAKLVMVVNMIGYCAMCFNLVSLKLQDVARNNTHQKDIKRIVRMHQDALECAGLVEEYVSPVLLLHIVMGVLIWCSILLFFTITGFRNSQSINITVLFLFNTAETVGLCYFGEALFRGSLQVGNAVYDVDWESQTVGVQADLQMILLRSQRPVGVTAGKFTFMNLELFAGIVQKTYSIYIVLKDVI